ncbi:MAG: ImmA/IrrE family metallo-endopeptidase [Roseomonas sp.]|nr:ImmA/IrrE family metallo-endopeptidase [Roseomonas sp.]
MGWFVDKSGRFPQRLYLRPVDIDRDCERLVSNFLQQRHGKVCFPLSTDDLTVLVEQHSSSLDQYADLSSEGDDVEGMTCFLRDKPPQVLISAQLTEQANRQNRLRTTLAHELGHAFYHRAVFDRLFAAPPHLFEAARAEPRTVCKRESMMGTSEFDWLEWQAGYFSGAILMPAQQVRRSVGDLLRHHGIHGAAVIDSAPAVEAEQQTMARFQVSAEAARVRLRKLGLLADSQGPPTLFG